MKNQAIYKQIIQRAASGKKQLAVLIDPDKTGANGLEHTVRIATEVGVDYFFMGGSLLTGGHISTCVKIVKDNSDLPVVLFPGSPSQVHAAADALLLLSLISGRNADLLIGRHVEAAPFIKQSGLEVIPTAYMLIDGGVATTASYISNTQPIPNNKPDIAAATAMAGEMLGLKTIYMDCGSGAKNPVPAQMIEKVRQAVELPIIVGGGIRNKEQLHTAYTAGADVAVVGNAIEEDPELLYYLGEVMRKPA